MIHIYYGKGKGKTSSALGLIIRACGCKKRIVLFRFLKPKSLSSGEDKILTKLPNLKEFRFDYPHPMFIKILNSKKTNLLKNQIKESLTKLETVAKQKKYDILVLDEILNLIDLGFVKQEYLLKLLRRIKNTKEVILTGRNMPKKIPRLADYITELRLVKHPFQKGILARRGIEY